jgi:hypothetical protein
MLYSTKILQFNTMLLRYKAIYLVNFGVGGSLIQYVKIRREVYEDLG